MLLSWSCPSLLQPHGLQPARLLYPWNSSSKNTRVGSQSLLKGIFPNQWSNLCLLHWRWILYCLSHQRSGKIVLKNICETTKDLYLGKTVLRKKNKKQYYTSWIQSILQSYINQNVMALALKTGTQINVIEQRSQK